MITKHLPLILLMAVSPLCGQSAEPYSPITYSSRAESVDVVQQDNPTGKKIGRTIRRTNDGQTCVLAEMDYDGDRATFELMGFGYRYKVGDDAEGVMNGIVRIICPEPLSDGSYRVVFKESHKNAPDGPFKVYRIPAEFGELVLEFAEFSRNNKAIYTATEATLIKKFGEEAVKNPPTMKEEVTTFVYKDGTEKVVPKSSRR